uniref:Uncharacterized protein n=1 Tax=Arundo donax TaxID=35708 RepID=A0A0A8ZA43_ARUDO
MIVKFEFKFIIRLLFYRESFTLMRWWS